MRTAVARGLDPDVIRRRGAGHEAVEQARHKWLQLHGIDELVAEGKAYWEAHAASPNVAAMRMRSRVSEAEALLDVDGLGAFTVVEWSA